MNTEEKIRQNMYTSRKKKTMPLGWALVLIAAIALAGGLAYYFQVDKNRELVAANKEAIEEQQYLTFVAFDQIEKNLAKIREHESMIQQDFTGPDKSGNLAPEERIQQEINFIEHLLAENNLLIESLEKELDDKDFRLTAYDKTVKDLKKRINDYQAKLDVILAEKESLQLDLDRTMVEKNDLIGQVDLLGRDLEKQDSLIMEQKRRLQQKENELSLAYYTSGTYKQLRDRNVVEKEGGFLGINRVLTLVDDPSSGQFENIDTRDVQRFPIFSKRFELVTDRDTSSYKVEYANDKAEWLNVTDPDKFWKKSRYLVIVVHDKDYDELAESR